MDVNGTPMHVVTGERDWQRVLLGAVDGAEWIAGRRAVGPVALPVASPRSGSAALQPDARRGAAIDRFGSIWWISDAAEDSATAIWMQAAADGSSAKVWSLDDLAAPCPPEPDQWFGPSDPPVPPRPTELRGLTVTTTSWMIVGARDPDGLLAFDLNSGGPPLWLPWPEDEQPLHAVELAAAPDGGFWLLAAASAGGAWRVHLFDRYFRRVALSPESERFILPPEPATRACEPAPDDPATDEPCRLVDGVALAGSPPLLEDPIAIEGAPDGTLWILDAALPCARIVRLSPVAGGIEVHSRELTDPDVCAVVHDFALQLDCTSRCGDATGKLHLVTNDKYQVVVYEVESGRDGFELTRSPRYYPTRDFTGKALLAGPADVFYDAGNQWVALAEQPRFRYLAAATIEGDGLTFDGKVPDCVWHRLLVDACIPSGCGVRVFARAADDRDDLATTPWGDAQPGLVLRPQGSELPFHEPFSASERRRDHLGTWELLLQRVIGRYVELRIEFTTDLRTAPWIRALRVHYQRFSYVERYLPAVYRDARESADFLERYLGNFEGVLTALEGRIEQAQVVLGPDSAPAEYLDWLAGWLGATLGEDWDEERRRLFLSRAEQLFRWRGTPIGLRALIRLGIDECVDESLFDELDDETEQAPSITSARSIRIVEHATRRAYSGVALGDPTAATGPVTFEQSAAWEPSHGAEPLHRAYADFLLGRYGGTTGDALAALRTAWQITESELAGFEAVLLPAVAPAQDAQLADWRAFLSGPIGFTYAVVTADDGAAWRLFLTSRYSRDIDRLNQAHWRTGDTQWDSFADITLPEILPEGGGELIDWIQFVSVSLPISRNAHRFTVLVPTSPGEPRTDRLARLARVEEIVEREKPAHTLFEAKLFWDLFQIGSARLGIDTAVGEGSRYVAMTLGEGYLGDSLLAAGHPWNVTDRMVLGRDTLSEN